MTNDLYQQLLAQIESQYRTDIASLGRIRRLSEEMSRIAQAVPKRRKYRKHSHLTPEEKKAAKRAYMRAYAAKRRAMAK